jgi:hypothetical protein
MVRSGRTGRKKEGRGGGLRMALEKTNYKTEQKTYLLHNIIMMLIEP